VVKDTFLLSNSAAFTVYFRGGYPEIIEEHPHVGLAIDISDFSSFWMESVDFHALWRYELVRLFDESYVGKL
jgi:hypothetical protein